ncbi:hypothetical protein P7C70_g3976, partial [Phenoliferia sp. Uapishka_3]
MLDVVFKSVSNVDISLDFYLPPNASKTAPVPILVWFHGGGLIQGSRKSITPHILSAPTKHNLCVVAPDYRLAPQTRFPGILSDIADFLNYIRSPAFLALTYGSVDQSKIIISGASAGGWLGLIAGTGIGFTACGLEVPETPVAIAAIYPISDLEDPFWKTKQHPVSYWPRVIEKEEMAEFMDPKAKEVSSSSGARQSFYHYMRSRRGVLESLLLDGTGIDPTAFSIAPRIKSGEFSVPSTFVVHGTIDDKVPMQQSIDIVEALKSQGVKYEFEIREGKDHSFDSVPEETMDRMYAFIAESLR